MRKASRRGSILIVECFRARDVVAGPWSLSLLAYSYFLLNGIYYQHEVSKRDALSIITCLGSRREIASISTSFNDRMKTPMLPSVLLPAISTIHYDLSRPSSPLHYQSLPDLPKKFLTEVMDLARAFDEAIASTNNIDEEAYLATSIALILLGNENVDEAHNLVLPYSWKDDMAAAVGPSKFAEVSSAARSACSYAHTLIHRYEGPNLGELNLVGFANAEFWTRQTLSHDFSSLPHEEV